MSKKVKFWLARLLINALLFAFCFALQSLFHPQDSVFKRAIYAAGSWLGVRLMMAVARFMQKDREDMEAFAAEWTRRQKERQYPADSVTETKEKTK